MPVKVETPPVLPGLSPVCGSPIVARFDGASMSSDDGLLALREVEQRLGIASRLAACTSDPRAPRRVRHALDAIISTRILMIAAGYEGDNDADSLRGAPMFKLAKGLLPDDAGLYSQPTISRLENLPDAPALLRMGHAMVDRYCQSFHQVPHRTTLAIDDTFQVVHGGQQLRLFDAHYVEYGFQPVVVFNQSGCVIAAVLRPVNRPSDRQIVRCLRLLITAIGGNCPRVEITLRADSYYWTPEVLRFYCAQRLDYTWPPPGGCASISQSWRSTAARADVDADGREQRHFKDFYDAAASWDRVERIIARVEGRAAGDRHTLYCHRPRHPVGPDDIPGELLCAGSGRKPHQGLEDTSGSRVARHAAAQWPTRCACSYWPMSGLRTLTPRRLRRRVAQFDTLCLIKLTVRIEVMTTQIRLYLPKATPNHAIFTLLLTRMPRLNR